MRNRARMRKPAAMSRHAHHGVEVWLCVEPVDFRTQITGLAMVRPRHVSAEASATRLSAKVRTAARQASMTPERPLSGLSRRRLGAGPALRTARV